MYWNGECELGKVGEVMFLECIGCCEYLVDELDFENDLMIVFFIW